ncbi:sugar ABC transporter substrate-binding protein [Saccharibacillus sp. CPCC 101409]|uniref:ABC transporter substrate-binding protein n=1 Tax=Saccharibacillus sp. CPCC 101409 TaxID=3058041 RepID=UPI002671EA9B|nr:sugar ABC transporter substrate-binding protein [Saccharibacillus sp. CPCC 101409]MDO3409267.1 sugar ABC transporter substrate-binding protein [Saccharibacillus sp. CPCC 101409]
MEGSKKRVPALIWILVLVAALLSACTKSDTQFGGTSNDSSSGKSGGESGDKITLRLTVWGAPEEVAPYKIAIEKFETEHPNIKVELQHIAADYDTKLTTMVAGNDVPDVAMMESASIAYPLAEQGKFYNLQDFLATDTEINDESLVPNITYSLEPGNVIGIAPGPEMFALFYNEEAFREAGVEPPPAKASEAWTWDEFVEVAKKLTLDSKGRTADDPEFDPKNIKQYGINMPTWWGSYSNFIYSNGGDFISEDGKTFALNRPEAVEALQKLADLVNVHHVAPSPVQAKNIPSTNVALQTKKVAMAVDGQWASAALAKSNFDFNVGVLPVMKKPQTTVVCAMFSMFKSTEHPEEAWELVKALIAPESSIDLLQAGTWMPAMRDWYTDPQLLDRWTANQKSRPSGYRDAVVDVLLNDGHQTPTGYVKNFNKIMDIVNPAMDKVWLGEQSAQEALDGIAAKAQAQVQGRRSAAE